MPNGILEVKVVKAEGLHGSKRAVLSRKKCPYVQVEVGQKLQRTRPLTKDASNHADVVLPANADEHNNNNNNNSTTHDTTQQHYQNCVWDETLVFRNIPDSMNYAVLHVYHDHTFHDECLGRVTLPLAEVKKLGSIDTTYPVMYDDKPCGTITIGLRFVTPPRHMLGDSSEARFARRPSSPVHSDWRECRACRGPVHKECTYCAHCGVAEPSQGGKKSREEDLRMGRVTSEKLRGGGGKEEDDMEGRDHHHKGMGIAAAAVAGGEILSKLLS